MNIAREILKRAGVVILAITLFLLVKGDIKPVVAEILAKGNMLYGFMMEDDNDKFSGKSIINCYMPVVGYVDSHYIENEYLDDPSYDYESQIEYIDIGHEGTMEEGDVNLPQGNKESEPSPGVEMQDGRKDGQGNQNRDEQAADIQNAMGNETEDNEGIAKNVTETEEAAEGNAAQLYSKSDLLDFNALLNKHYTVTSITELKEDKFDVEQALEQDMTLQGDNTQPQILIFHTHSQEEFADSIPGDPSTSIVAVGARLAEILSSEYGYNVIHDTSVYDYVNGVLDRSKAYTYAEQGIQSILDQYPSIEVVLDIHRDGVNENIHLVTDVNGKPTAQMMFFNGISYTKVNGDIDYLQNPYIQDNLAMSLQMYLLGSSKYPDLLRRIYIHGYRYCLHFRAKSMLIEVGAQNNTLQEELNAMEPLAETLHRLFSGEKGYE